MIKHWFKLIWNRKKQNFLLMLEMFIAFLVICVLFVQGARVLINYQRPLGFEYENVWAIGYRADSDDGKWTNKATAEKFFEVKRVLESFDEVEAVSAADMVPFTYNMSNSSDSIPGERFSIEMSQVMDDFKEVMGLELIEGEWFNESHDALNFTPLVINERLAKKIFQDKSPLGQNILPHIEGTYSEQYTKMLNEGKVRERKVVGVVKSYRKYGDLHDPIYFSFQRTSPSDTTLFSFRPSNIVVKVKPSAMSGAFEEKMTKALEQLAPKWSFSLSTLSKHEETRTKRTLTPLISFALVAGFLMIMIALGMVGVLWQNITARRPEIGLRRALGASRVQIFSQVTGELLVIASVSILAGSLIAWQFPLLDIISGIPTSIYFMGWLVATVFLYLVTAICGMYPSIMATNISPTEALHDE